MNRILRYFLLYGLIFLAIMGIFSSLNNPNPKTKEIPTNEFYSALEKGDIESLSFQPVAGVLTVEGVMKGYEEGEKFTTNILANDPIPSWKKFGAVGKATNPTIQCPKST